KILSISISYWRICLHRPKALLRNSAPSTRDQGSRSTQPGRAQVATPFQYQTGHGEICRKCRDFLCAAVIWTREPPAQPGFRPMPVQHQIKAAGHRGDIQHIEITVVAGDRDREEACGIDERG